MLFDLLISDIIYYIYDNFMILQTPQNSITPITHISYVIINIYFNFICTLNPKDNPCNFHLEILRSVYFSVLFSPSCSCMHHFTSVSRNHQKSLLLWQLTSTYKQLFSHSLQNFLIILDKCIGLKLSSLLLPEAKSLPGYLHLRPLFQILSQIHIFKCLLDISTQVRNISNVGLPPTLPPHANKPSLNLQHSCLS